LQFYYHSDHLGSSSLIPDLDGNEAQHIEYGPFGEVFIEERNSTWNTPYKFNAKELDEETGLYYYGARYYDPRVSVWLGVDLMAEKYPGVSGYTYCANNPVKFIDPDGKEKLNGLYNPKRKYINEPLLVEARRHKDNKMIHIYVHGSYGGGSFTYYGKDGYKKEVNDATTLKELLKDQSKIWNNRKSDEKVTVVLHACRTGETTSRKPLSLGEYISEDFKEGIIVAPSKQVEITTSGETIRENGTWNYYEKGTKIKSEKGVLENNPDLKITTTDSANQEKKNYWEKKNPDKSPTWGWNSNSNHKEEPKN
jgi:RHS repeat-associated protein